MKTNDLKKGDRVRLANGWEAEIADGKKGQTRLAKVFGYETEIESVYAHDISDVWISTDSEYFKFRWLPIEHTKEQVKLREAVKAAGL